MPKYPKYHPPIDWPYAVEPEGRNYRVLPSPAQRIGKKERRLWGATVQSVPYAYEDPYLTSVQDTQYTVDSSMMHRYPYVRQGEDLGRAPMLFQQPFGSANAISGSANYLDSFEGDDYDELDDQYDEFGFDIGKALQNLDLGKAIEGIQGFASKHKLKTKFYQAQDGMSALNKLKAGISGRKKKRKSRKRKSGKKLSPQARARLLKKFPHLAKRGMPFASGPSGAGIDAISSVVSSIQNAPNLPEPMPVSNLFSQAAENDKVNVVSRLKAGQQLPIRVNQAPVVAQLQSAEVELTQRAQDVQDTSEKLEKSKKKNNVLLYTSIGGGVVTLGLLSYILISKK